MKKILIILFVLIPLIVSAQPFDASGYRPYLTGVLNFDTSLSAPDFQTGRLYWSDDDKTLSLMTEVEGTELQIGQESYVFAKNNTGAQIDNGQVVYIGSASTGVWPQVYLAQADSVNTANVIAIATNDVADASFGYFTAFGVVRGVDTSGYAAGDILYLSESTAGLIANSEPATGFVIRVGIALNSGVDGAIFVRPEVCGALCKAVFADDVEVTGDVSATNASFSGLLDCGAGSIDTTELADDAVTADKLDETGDYTVNDLNTTGKVSIDTESNAATATGTFRVREVQLADDDAVNLSTLFDLSADATGGVFSVVLTSGEKAGLMAFFEGSGNTSTLLIDYGAGAISDTDGKICLYPEGATGDAILKNRLGVTYGWVITYQGVK